MLQDHAATRKKIPLRAVYVYLPEHATQFRSSVQAGLQQLHPTTYFEPPGQRPQDAAPVAGVNQKGDGATPTPKDPDPGGVVPMDTTKPKEDDRPDRDPTASSSQTDPVAKLLLGTAHGP